MSEVQKPKIDGTEKLIIEQLKQGNERAYKYLYDHHYPILCHVASQYVCDDFLAETIVGDVIFHLWEVRDSIRIESSLRSYLTQSVRNRCLDYLNSQQVQREQTVGIIGGVDSLPVMRYLHSDDYPLGRLLEKELEEEIAQSIDRLPADCQKVFRLSRFEGLKNEEIAKTLGISVNTVKYHMKHALALLHNDLQKYLVMAFIAFIQG